MCVYVSNFNARPKAFQVVCLFGLSYQNGVNSTFLCWEFINFNGSVSFGDVYLLVL